MADKLSRESIGELSVKVDVDVSDALAGLKALQREAKKAAQALRELEKLRESYGTFTPYSPFTHPSDASKQPNWLPKITCSCES